MHFATRITIFRFLMLVPKNERKEEMYEREEEGGRESYSELDDMFCMHRECVWDCECLCCHIDSQKL